MKNSTYSVASFPGFPDFSAGTRESFHCMAAERAGNEANFETVDTVTLKFSWDAFHEILKKLALQNICGFNFENTQCVSFSDQLLIKFHRFIFVNVD